VFEMSNLYPAPESYRNTQPYNHVIFLFYFYKIWHFCLCFDCRTGMGPNGHMTYN